MSGEHYDLIIKNGLLYTQIPGTGPIDPGFVAIAGGVIAAMGPMADLPAPTNAARVIDARNHLVMPGLVNCHVHAAMTLFRGLADDLALMTWLNDYIFPAEAKHVHPEMAYWGTKLACAEMLLSGTTTMADGYFLEDHAARAVRDSGMRAILGQGVVDFPAPGVPDPQDNLSVAADFIQGWQGVSPLIAPSIFCHAPYTCSRETLLRGKELARRQGVLFQIHLSETKTEVQESLKKHGLTPVRYLDSLGILDEHTLAVHCVHVDEEDMDILVQRQVPVCHCLESTAKLASGLTPIHKMVEKGVKLALGTDGPASNNDLNMFGEMRSAALFFKLVTLNPTLMPSSQVLRLGGPRGAEALGLGAITGELSPGRRADLILLDLSQPNLQPMYHPESHLVYAATGSEVRTVIVEGRVLVENGRLLAFNLEETVARVQEIARNIAK